MSIYDIRFIVSFLKSSFYLWYAQNKYRSTNFADYEIFRDLRLPIIKLKRPDSQKQIRLINDTFNYIIKEERKFIAEFNKAYIRKKTDAKNEFIIKHNARIAQRFYAIDQSIYNLLGLSDNEIDVIENNLKFNKIYLPNNIDTSP